MREATFGLELSLVFHCSGRSLRMFASCTGPIRALAIYVGNFLRTQVTPTSTRMTEDHSRYRSGTLEGLVIWRENGEWLDKRAKIVHPDFQQAISDHWRSRSIEWNQLARPKR